RRKFDPKTRFMPAQEPNNPDLQNCSFSNLVELYRQMVRDGEAPDVETLVETLPHLEEQIRSQLPLIRLLDNALGDEAKDAPDFPSIVAGCVLKEEVGRGGMGVVFKAHQPELDRDVAIKIIRLDSDGASRTQRFELERHALARLDHPNVVPAYSFTQDENYAYLVMKLVRGYGLNQLIAGEGGPAIRSLYDELTKDWTRFASLAADVASGLAHAHEYGLIHRDMKPGNLLLDDQGKVWIGDFGLAKMLEGSNLSLTGDVVGTPRYMAPEQLHGSADARSDVYSLGLTLYELATGQSARGAKWQPTLDSNAVPQIEPIRNINPYMPRELADVIMKACHFIPDERYQSAKELELILRRFVSGQTPDRRRNRLPDAAYRKAFRFKAALSVASCVLMLAWAGQLFRSAEMDLGETPAANWALVDASPPGKPEANSKEPDTSTVQVRYDAE
ncbi:MAG: serine/threonine protein kinase, partial [Planctomycetaceae bacterium]